jgi:arylsulfatase A-like enzyme
VNLVVITCHDLGRYLGCYGIETVRTPHIDALAQEGVKFTQSFAAAPQCSPARAAMTTGRHPHCTGVLGLTHGRFAWDLTEDQVTVPQYLSSHGYHTVLAGLQHEANRTARLGFDDLLARCPGHDFAGVTCMDIAASASNFLQSQQQQDKPFYLQVGLFEPHRDPQSPSGFPEGLMYDDQNVTVPNYMQDTPQAREELRHFQAAVQLADQAVGQIVKTLKQTGLDHNTLLVFTSDHGIPFPRAKCTLFDAGLEVPLLMTGPNLPTKPGQIYDGLMSMIDLFPTVCELIGIAIPSCVQGVSHVEAMLGRQIACEEIYAQMTFHDYYDPLRMIRTDRYKLIASFEATRAWMDPTQQWLHQSNVHPTLEKAGLRHPPLRLYDLHSDPIEARNLVDDPAYASIVTMLATRLLHWMDETQDPVLEGMPVSPAHRQAVNSLLQAAGNTIERVSMRQQIEVTP